MSQKSALSGRSHLATASRWGAVVAAAVVLGACGSTKSATGSTGSGTTAAPAAASTSASTSAGTSTTTSGGATTTTAAYSGSGSSASTSPAVDTATVAGLGTVLVNGAGDTLYLYEPDAQHAVTCTGGCAGAWPALAGGAAKAGSGVNASLLGTDAGPNGTQVVTYNHWPLYTFAGDKAPGEAKGQGIGGVWWVVSPSGQAIQAKATADVTPAPTTTTAGSGGW
jgi:predicted lipoprotein with Yx(FWY)xxD motif